MKYFTEDNRTALAACFVGCCIGWIAAFAYLSRHDGRPKFAGVLTDIRRMERDHQEHVEFVVGIWRKKVDEERARSQELRDERTKAVIAAREEGRLRALSDAVLWRAGEWTVDPKTGHKQWVWFSSPGLASR